MLEWEAHSQPLLFFDAGETQGDMITSNGQAEKTHLRLVNMTLGASTQPLRTSLSIQHPQPSTKQTAQTRRDSLALSLVSF